MLLLAGGDRPLYPGAYNRGTRSDLVIFDCDGVLVDSEGIALAVTRRRLGEAGLSLTEEETRARFLGLRLDSVVAKAETALGAPLPKAFSDDLSREILDAFARGLKGVEGVRQAVGALLSGDYAVPSGPGGLSLVNQTRCVWLISGCAAGTMTLRRDNNFFCCIRRLQV